VIRRESDFRSEESFIERAESSCKKYLAVFISALFQNRAAVTESWPVALLLLYVRPTAKSTPLQGIAIARQLLHFSAPSSSKPSPTDSLRPQIF
jgi:hypothetical protein